jgi:hypothetical protein
MVQQVVGEETVMVNLVMGVQGLTLNNLIQSSPQVLEMEGLQ